MSAIQDRFDRTLERADAVLDQRVRRERRKLAEEEAAQARADEAEARADDDKCRDLAAEYQADYAAFGLEPPLCRSDEWSSDFHRRLVRGLQRRLDSRNDLANPHLLDGLRSQTFRIFADRIREEAAREAAQPSYSNLPESVYDKAAKLERTDSATGARVIEFRAKRSFIHDFSPPSKRAFIADPRTLRGQSMINRDTFMPKHATVIR